MPLRPPADRHQQPSGGRHPTPADRALLGQLHPGPFSQHGTEAKRARSFPETLWMPQPSLPQAGQPVPAAALPDGLTRNQPPWHMLPRLQTPAASHPQAAARPAQGDSRTVQGGPADGGGQRRPAVVPGELCEDRGGLHGGGVHRYGEAQRQAGGGEDDGPAATAEERAALQRGNVTTGRVSTPTNALTGSRWCFLLPCRSDMGGLCCRL